MSATFPDVGHHIGRYRVPILAGTIAFLLGRRERIVPAGDHLVLFAEVLEHRSQVRDPILDLLPVAEKHPLTGVERPGRRDHRSAQSTPSIGGTAPSPSTTKRSSHRAKGG